MDATKVCPEGEEGWHVIQLRFRSDPSGNRAETRLRGGGEEGQGTPLESVVTKLGER